MDELLVNILLAALLLSLMTAPLGCFVVWRKMAYFGSALSHSAILGIVIGLLLGMSTFWGMIVTAIIMSLVLLQLQKKQLLSDDSLLGLLAHVTLALGLVLLVFIEPVYIDLNSYLFGDILAIDETDVQAMFGVTLIVLVVIKRYWKDWLLLTINEDLAVVDGVKVYQAQLTMMLTLALVIAAAIKLTGLLLITSLLIIPAAAARYISNTPLQMMKYATIVSLLSTTGGLFMSYQFDLPAGPAIVLVSFGFFVLMMLGRAVQGK
jgi:zinc transport system permease protein